MQLDNKTLKYLKCRQSSGKNRFARTMDLILGTAVSLVILFCLLWSNGKGIVGSIILAATVSLAGAVLFLIIGKYRFERFLSRYLEQIRQNAVLEKITLLPARQFRAICKRVFESETRTEAMEPLLGGLYCPSKKIFCFAFQNHPSEPVGVQQMLLLYRKIKKLGVSHALVLSASGYGLEADTLSQRLHIHFTLLGAKQLLDAAKVLDISATDQDVLDAIHAEMSCATTRQQLKKDLFSRRKIRSYLLVAFVLMCWTLMTGFQLIYSIISIICIILSGYTYYLSRKQDISPK